MLVCTSACANRTRDRGCSVHPVFPAPSDFERANQDANLGRKCAARMRSPIHPSLRAQRSNPLSPRARKDGLLRCARNDNGSHLRLRHLLRPIVETRRHDPCVVRHQRAQRERRAEIWHVGAYEGEFDTSTTMSAPASAGCRPSPVTALTPLLGDACSTSWPRARSRGANFEPIRPVPPMITIFISSLLSLKPRHPALHHQDELQGAGVTSPHC